METNRRKREPVRLGTHGENYGNWMSAPVFYMVGALIVLMAALCVISHFIPGMDPIGVLALVVAAAALILLGCGIVFESGIAVFFKAFGCLSGML